MPANIQLESLDLSELYILLGHLRLGEAHLKKQLNAEQFNKLFSLSSLQYEQAKKINSDKLEKIGNVALALNTVITSIFGAWMGFSGFFSLRLNSVFIFSIICLLALFGCSIVGYFNFRLTVNNANAAIKNQKITNLQEKILQLIIHKQQEALNSITNFLNYSLYYIQSKTYFKIMSFSDKEDTPPHYEIDIEENYPQWLEELITALHMKADIINEKNIYKFYGTRLLKIVAKLEKITAYECPQEEESEEDKEPTVIDVLSSTFYSTPVTPPHRSWLVNNFIGLMAGSIPTLLGGFASMFVFLVGGPNLAKDFGLSSLANALRSWQARWIELEVALFLTVYYVASFIYSNYKNYLRQEELQQSQKNLMQLENEEIELRKQYQDFIHLKGQVRRAINIYTAIDNIALFQNEEQYETKEEK